MLSLYLLTLVLTADPEVNPEQRELLHTFRQEFVPITPGQGQFPRSFRMGGERGEEQPQHEVTFQYNFEMARYEVPQNMWQAVMGDNPSRWKGKRNSVEMITFEQAQEFCRRATNMMRDAELIGADQLIRLPSEAEWEYAARAGTTTDFSFGDDVADLAEYAWFTGNAAGNDPPVGAKKPNPWGLYDMHGYLWEWCLDVGHADYQGAPTDGSAWVTGGNASQRVIRSGSWKDAAPALRSAARAGRFPHRQANGEVISLDFQGGVTSELADDAVGLRCVLAPAR
jgi:formylglycine-generating enzyme required for sulfatase activity